ncbi:hypothetical protein LguiB_002113 [Lonicera macranthoides]
MSDYLPQEVLLEILSRLPVQSLLKFRCVSKSWNSLITSPNFITIHINQSLASDQTNNTHTLFRHYTLTHKKELFSYRSDTDDTFDEYQDLKCPLKSKYGYYTRIIGTCNGLLCLSDDIFRYTNTVFLWNPSIRRYLTLPVPRVTTDLYKHLMSVYGFGFDPNTNDYKVVRISYEQGDNGYVFPPKVELYKLSTLSWVDLCWDQVRGGLPTFGVGEHFWTQVYMKGKVHWVGYRRIRPSSVCCFILLFDMEREVFSEMELPESLVRGYPLSISVALLGESLSVLQYDKCVHSKGCTIWIMKEYGSVGSWSKLYSINLQRRLVRTLGLRKNGDLLLAVGKDLVSYNPESEKFKNLGVRSARDAFHVASYVESLVLLKEGHEVPVEAQNSVDEEADSHRAVMEHMEYAIQFFTDRSFNASLIDLLLTSLVVVIYLCLMLLILF